MYDRFGKRLLDLLLAGVGLLLLAPVLILIASLVRFAPSPRERGPVFYRGERVGLNGRPFAMFKYRSMVTDADAVGPSSTSADDPRLTGLGAFLRRYKLDELPQLLNVLAGGHEFRRPAPRSSQVHRPVHGGRKSDPECAPGHHGLGVAELPQRGRRAGGLCGPL